MHTLRKSQSGQATIEYVLLLVVSVAVVLGLATQFFKPFQVFIDSYMGDYVACLLEVGELPSLGAEAGAAEEEGCNARFEPATLANGRPPAAAGNQAGSQSKGASRESSSGGGSSYAGSSSRNGSNRFFSSQQGSKGGDSVSEQAQNKQVEIALDGGGSGGFFASGSYGTNTDNRRPKSVSVPLERFSEEERKKLEKKKEGNGRIIASEAPGTPPKKTNVKFPEKKSEIVEKDEPFTIGNFMRILFIIAIILAIVVFVGGQVLQMSKSSRD